MSVHESVVTPLSAAVLPARRGKVRTMVLKANLFGVPEVAVVLRCVPTHRF